MLSPKLVDALNKQINLEFYSSNLYMQMSAWCSAQGLDGAAAFLQRHAGEETGHMRRLFTYVNETGSMAVIGAIEAPPVKFQSLLDVFQQTFEHEQRVTGAINKLVETALALKDYSTVSFLQWYVAEQHEEERLFKAILDKIQIIGTDGRGLFLIDREIERLTTPVKAGT
jgi:ferritin